MLNQIEAGKPFHLKDLVEYEEGKAVKKTVASAEGASIVVVAMDKAELADHPAPQDAVFTVLDGDGELTYLGTPIKVRHGMSIKFDKGAVHSVKTDHKLKFMLMFF